VKVKFEEISLEIAGLLTCRMEKGSHVITKISTKSQINGSLLTAPFMTMSFMALLVIPELKLSDRGLFDVQKFGFTDLFPYRKELIRDDSNEYIDYLKSLIEVLPDDPGVYQFLIAKVKSYT